MPTSISHSSASALSAIKMFCPLCSAIFHHFFHWLRTPVRPDQISKALIFKNTKSFSLLTYFLIFFNYSSHSVLFNISCRCTKKWLEKLLHFFCVYCSLILENFYGFQFSFQWCNAFLFRCEYFVFSFETSFWFWAFSIFLLIFLSISFVLVIASHGKDFPEMHDNS